jgi:hypothetical protein
MVIIFTSDLLGTIQQRVQAIFWLSLSNFVLPGSYLYPLAIFPLTNILLSSAVIHRRSHLGPCGSAIRGLCCPQYARWLHLHRLCRLRDR